MGAALCCCGEPEPAPRQPRPRRRSQRSSSEHRRSSHERAGSSSKRAPILPVDHDGSSHASVSDLDDDFHSCTDAFSYVGGSSPASLSPLRRSLDAGVSACYPATCSGSSPVHDPPSHASSSDASALSTHSPRAGCLPDVLGHTLGVLGHTVNRQSSVAAARRASVDKAGEQGEAAQQQQQREQQRRKCDAGASMTLRTATTPEAQAASSYEDGDAPHYNIRSASYMTSKVKIHSDQSLYELVAADTFAFGSKQTHIAQMVNLPTPHPDASPSSIPPLLIINIQIPTYQPSVWGKTDGPGCSVVFYFRLRPGFDAATFPNQKALQLYERFVLDGKEKDGTLTRDRFKLIGRVVNVDDWAREGPLSTAEHRLLTAYNEKPFLTRPQHHLFRGPNYLEVDIDIHTYAYLARAAFQAYIPRLGPVVWENAFVIQGNSGEELPEQVLACGRIYRTDLANLRPFSSYLPA